jgi:hypothetical protein
MQTVFNTEDWHDNNEVLVKTILGLLRLVSKNRWVMWDRTFCFELNSGAYIEEQSISPKGFVESANRPREWNKEHWCIKKVLFNKKLNWICIKNLQKLCRLETNIGTIWSWN